MKKKNEEEAWWTLEYWVKKKHSWNLSHHSIVPGLFFILVVLSFL